MYRKTQQARAEALTGRDKRGIAIAGGALLHACGSRAAAMCKAAFRHDDKLSLLTRPQCRLAGLGPASTTPATPSGG